MISLPLNPGLYNSRPLTGIISVPDVKLNQKLSHFKFRMNNDLSCQVMPGQASHFALTRKA